VKVLKPHAVRMAQSDDAQLVLFCALDAIEYVTGTLRIHDCV
jgi:hypothetical protein